VLKVLIVGLGGIGQRHVRNLRTLLGGDVEILAYRVRRLAHVVTPRLQTVPDSDVEHEYALRVFERLEDALEQRPHVAFICNPTSLHVPAALACVRAGCDLFLEKPVSHDLAGVDELLAAVRSRQRIAMVGYQLRFHPCFQALDAIVREKRIGSVLSVRAVVGEYLPGWHPYEDYRQMYASRADLGGGVIVSQIHEFDYLYALFGLPRRVFAVGGQLSDLEIDVEDVASTLMAFDVDGRTIPVHLHQDYLQRPPSRSCDIVGSRGKVVMNLAPPALTRYEADGRVAESHQWDGWDRNEAFLSELRHFLDCVATRRTPIVDLAGGIASLRMALAAKASLASGQVVELGAEEHARG
jgi:predicted dehydrogenase